MFIPSLCKLFKRPAGDKGFLRSGRWMCGEKNPTHLVNFPSVSPSKFSIHTPSLCLIHLPPLLHAGQLPSVSTLIQSQSGNTPLVFSCYEIRLDCYRTSRAVGLLIPSYWRKTLKTEVQHQHCGPQTQSKDIKQDEAKGVKEQNRTLCAFNKRWNLEKTLWKSQDQSMLI